MGKTYESITPELQTWLAAQRMFFVATAPLAARSRVNCSPKSAAGFRILGPREVAYLDLTGSGVETVAHVRENGRIVLMFCAFEGPPRIVRLHGHGTVHEPGDPEYEEFAARLPSHASARAIIRVEVERVSSACGFGVPLFAHQGERDHHERWVAQKGAEGVVAYRREKNRTSVDGLPGLRSAAEQRERRSAPFDL